MNVTIFKSQAACRKWLQRHHADTSELWMGFYNRSSGKVGITYKQALDEALCFGWIDGVRRRIDDATYTIRFTPRKKVSNWSQVNIKRAQELADLGLMAEAGLRELTRRSQKTAPYSYENRPESLSPEYKRMFQDHPEAWTFFCAQAPGYRRTASYWVLSAKKEETRRRRLETLIRDSDAGRRLAMLTPRKAQ